MNDLSWLQWPLIWLSLGMGIGFANHGFSFITIHKHYHSKDGDTND